MAAVPSDLICCNCGQSNPQGSRACTACASKHLCPEDEVVECSDCDKMNPPDAKACIHCKAKFVFDEDDETEDEEGQALLDEKGRLNKWVEYRDWVFFWGLLLDSQEVVNELLLEHNKKGWKCIQVWRQAGVVPNLPIGTLVMVLLVSLVTLGFVQYYVGPALLMEKVES